MAMFHNGFDIIGLKLIITTVKPDNIDKSGMHGTLQG